MDWEVSGTEGVTQTGTAAGTMAYISPKHAQGEEGRPVLTVNEASRRTSPSLPTAAKGMTRLADLGIARELTGNRRNRVFPTTVTSPISLSFVDRSAPVKDRGSSPVSRAASTSAMS